MPQKIVRCESEYYARHRAIDAAAYEAERRDVPVTVNVLLDNGTTQPYKVYPTGHHTTLTPRDGWERRDPVYCSARVAAHIQ